MLQKDELSQPEVGMCPQFLNFIIMRLDSETTLCCSNSLEKHQSDPDDDSEDDSGIGTSSTFTVTKNTTFTEVHSFYHSVLYGL